MCKTIILLKINSKLYFFQLFYVNRFGSFLFLLSIKSKFKIKICSITKLFNEVFIFLIFRITLLTKI